MIKVKIRVGESVYIKRFIAFMLIFIVLFNVCVVDVAYAVGDSSDDKDYLDDEDIDDDIGDDRDISDIESYRMSRDEFNKLFQKMVKDFLDAEKSDFYFEDVYKSDSEYETKVMHTPLMLKTSDSGGKGNIAFYNHVVARTNSDGFSGNMTRPNEVRLCSDFIDGGVIEWRSLSVPARYTNFYTHAIFKASGEDKKGQYEQEGLGIDVFGNIITNKRRVVVPFYMNPYFLDKLEDKVKKDSIGKPENKISFIPSGVDQKVAYYFKDADIPKNRITRVPYNISAFYIDKNGDKVFIQGGTGSKKDDSGKIKYISNRDLSLFMSENGEAGAVISRKKTEDFIIDNFEGIVWDFYNYCFDVEKEGGALEKLYVGDTDYGRSELMNDPEARKEELGDILTAFLKGGLGELLKLTMAFTVADMYEDIFVNFSSKYIFHTSYYEDDVVYDNLKGAYMVLLIALAAFFVIFSAVNIVLGRLTLGDLIKRLVVILLVGILPVVVYPKMVNFMFNKSTSKIAEGQINKLMLLDRWALLAQEDFDETREQLPFEMSREFRGLDYNYLVKFKTNEVQDDFTTLGMMELDGDNEGENDYSKKAKRVYAYIDANHLIEYFKDDESSGELFNYLAVNDSDNYGNFISGDKVYTEYGLYVDNSGSTRKDANLLDVASLLGTGEQSGYVKSSDIGKKVFNFYKDTGLDLGARMEFLAEYMLDSKITNASKDKIVGILADKPLEDIERAYMELGEEDFNSQVQYRQFLLEKELLEECGYGDILGVYGLLKDITVIKDDYEGQDKILRFKTYDITKNVIDYYMQNIWTVKMRAGNAYIDRDAFLEAENDLLKLRIFFEICKEFGEGSFPVGVDISKVESDVYIRSLVIPYKDITPDNRGVENAALYVGAYGSTGSLILFVVMIVAITAYGLIKLVTVSTFLMPLFLVLFIWTYIFKRDYESKLWFGVLYIIGVFALVHIGFMGIWYFITSMMDKAYSSGVSIGRTSFFNHITNCIIVSVYFYFVIRYVIVPTLKVAASNAGDLGGGYFMARTQNIIGNIAGKTKDIMGVRKDGGSSFKGEVAGEKDISEEERRIDELKRSKVRVESSGAADKSELIDKEIDKRKAEEVKKVSADSEGVGSLKVGLKSGKVYEDMEENKITDAEKEVLKRTGVYGGAVKSVENDRAVGSFIEAKNPVVRKSIGKYFKGKYDVLEDSDGVHVKADGSAVEGMSDDFSEYMEGSLSKLRDIGVKDYEDVSGLGVLGGKYRVLADEKASVGIERLKEEGVITGVSEVEGEDGQRYFEMDVEKGSTDKFNEMMSGAGVEGAIEVAKAWEADKNGATVRALDNLVKRGVLEGYQEIKGDDGEEKVRFYGDEKAANEFCDVSEVFNKSLGLGVEGEDAVCVSGESDLLEHLIESDEVLKEGENYIKCGDRYISKDAVGKERLRRAFTEAEKTAGDIEKEYEELGCIELRESSAFELDKSVAGRRHYVSDTSVCAKDILKSINEIKYGDVEDDEARGIKERLKSVYSVGEVDGRLVIYTGSDIDKEYIGEFMQDIQRYAERKRGKRGEGEV